MLDGPGYTFCADVDTVPPPGWDASKARKYKTFISVAAQYAGRPVGMVTVDSTALGDLDEGDVRVAGLFATLIAMTDIYSKKSVP